MAPSASNKEKGKFREHKQTSRHNLQYMMLSNKTARPPHRRMNVHFLSTVSSNKSLKTLGHQKNKSDVAFFQNDQG